MAWMTQMRAANPWRSLLLVVSISHRPRIPLGPSGSPWSRPRPQREMPQAQPLVSANTIAVNTAPACTRA
jgi:hypothetical protein